MLIGASRERVGFDRPCSVEVVRGLAAQAVRLFPVLADVSLLRVYRGFRPYCPDHLPVIGPDPRVPGLLHACGHEGAGIGLAPATGALIADLLAGRAPEVDAVAASGRTDSPSGGRVSGPAFTFDGRPIPFRPGQSVGAALLAAGVRSWRTTRVDGRPRGAVLRDRRLLRLPGGRRRPPQRAGLPGRGRRRTWRSHPGRAPAMTTSS